MSPYRIIAQVIGIVAMAFNILSYQQKHRAGIITFQLLGSLLFTAHFFMLGAYTGGMLNAVSIVRAIVFLLKDKLHTDNLFWLVGFELVYVASYVLTFTVFRTDFNAISAIIELLPIIGMTATTFAFRCTEAKKIRLLGFISSPSWLIYNVTSLAIGAICCEALALVSITVGYLRHDRKKQKMQADAPSQNDEK